MKRWPKKYLNTLAQIVTVKISAVSKLNFIFQVLPVEISEKKKVFLVLMLKSQGSTGIFLQVISQGI